MTVGGNAYLQHILAAALLSFDMAALSLTPTAQSGPISLPTYSFVTLTTPSTIVKSPLPADYPRALVELGPSLAACSVRVSTSSKPGSREIPSPSRFVQFRQTPSIILQHFVNIIEWVSLLISRTKTSYKTHEYAQDNRPDSLLSYCPSNTLSSSECSQSGDLLGEIPQYVIEHAPLIHLYSKEKFWPGDISKHLRHVSVYVNYFQLGTEKEHRNVTNLDELNAYGLPIYLTSDDDVSYRPTWLRGAMNVPLEPGSKKGPAGRSKAPVPLIVVDKGGGVVDAFWFFFYSFNLGNEVLGMRYGNHVGDWEHTVVRFQDGKPSQVFFSEHTSGRAFTYEAVEKIGKRPVGYSASGTHAMYATAAVHRYILPWGLLQDVTDRGPLWDPALNMYAYTYDVGTGSLHASNVTPEAPISWFYYDGRWGDKRYKMEDKRQYRYLRNYHYVDGPQGPRFKELDRSDLCSGHVGCSMQDSLEAGVGVAAARMGQGSGGWGG